MNTSYQIKIGGLQGEGVDKTGVILTKYLNRLGFYLFGYREYNSLIKGGHTTFQVHFSAQPVYAQIKRVDLLVALNEDTVKLHQDELSGDSVVIYDPGEFQVKDSALTGRYVPIPLLQITKEAGGIPLMANMTACGALAAMLSLPLPKLDEQIEHIFGYKGKAMVDANQKVAKAGYDYLCQHFPKIRLPVTLPSSPADQIVLFGNEAVALGAVAGGLQFYASYPMTPTSNMLHTLAAWAKKSHLVVKHAEDEISAVGMALGAAFTGVRAMTGTSGGGFCLMTEHLGFSGIAEVPLVIVNGQRPGPAIGMPTWTSQGDLAFVIHASHDELPRVVLAPGDQSEAITQTKQALELAEKYQLPVIILTDKYLAESLGICRNPSASATNRRFGFTSTIPAGWHRYTVTDGGISARSRPGDPKGMYVCNSYEHDPDGRSSENASDRQAQVDKRFAKLKELQKVIPEQPVYGDKKAKTGIISWGSTVGPVQEALKSLPGVKALHLSWLWPFPHRQVSEFIAGSDRVIVAEGNKQGQLANLISQELQIKITHRLLKYDGRPFWPEEIIQSIKNYK